MLSRRVRRLEQRADPEPVRYAIVEDDAEGEPRRLFVADERWTWHERPMAELSGAVLLRRMAAGLWESLHGGALC
jgi:hypothetical protein